MPNRISCTTHMTQLPDTTTPKPRIYRAPVEVVGMMDLMRALRSSEAVLTRKLEAVPGVNLIRIPPDATIIDCDFRVAELSVAAILAEHFSEPVTKFPTARLVGDCSLFGWTALYPRPKQWSYTRASFESICPVCDRYYFQHPNIKRASWLHRLCSGKLVKL